MATVSTRWTRSIEGRSPTLFLVSGAMLLLLLAVGSIVRFTAVSIPRTEYWTLFPVAVAFSMGGLVGLSPRLAERAWRAAIIGGGFGLFGGFALVGGLCALLVAAPPGPYPGNLGVLGAPFFLGLLAFVLAMGIYGVASLLTGVLSRKVGTLLLLVALLQFGELIGAVVLFPSAGTSTPSAVYVLFETAAYSVIATSLLAVGYSLRREAVTAEREDTVNVPELGAEAR